MTMIHDQEFDPYLHECVTIDPLNITGEFIRVSADIAYWSQKAADAEDSYLRAKNKLVEVEALCEIALRTQAENMPKKPTESAISAAVKSTPQVALAREALVVATVDRKSVDGYLSAISTKREMLISLGAHMRKEMLLEPSIRN